MRGPGVVKRRGHPFAGSFVAAMLWGAVALAAEDYEALSARGDAAMAQGRLAEAQAAYQDSLRLPQRVGWDANLSRLVRVAVQQGRGEALKSSAGLDARGMLLRALLETAGGDLATARKTQESAVAALETQEEAGPELAPPLTLLAVLQHLSGDAASAKATADRAAGLRAKVPGAREDPLDHALLVAVAAAAKEKGGPRAAADAWGKAAAALEAAGGAGLGLRLAALELQARWLEKAGKGGAAKAIRASLESAKAAGYGQVQAGAQGAESSVCCFSSPGFW